MERKITDNMRMVFNALAEFDGRTAFAKEVLAKLEAAGVKGKTFNGVNATLAALAGRGIVSKVKAPYNEKMYTKYTIVKELPTDKAE
jgi:Fe2+ or Zn2+ uptake regulation protein